MTNTVDDLLEKLREQLTTRRQESEDRVGRIKAAGESLSVHSTSVYSVFGHTT